MKTIIISAICTPLTKDDALHVSGALGRHHNHWSSHRPAATGGASGPRGGPTNAVRQQPQTLGLAILNYESTFGYLPPGGWSRNYRPFPSGASLHAIAPQGVNDYAERKSA